MVGVAQGREVATANFRTSRAHAVSGGNTREGKSSAYAGATGRSSNGTRSTGRIRADIVREAAGRSRVRAGTSSGADCWKMLRRSSTACWRESRGFRGRAAVQDVLFKTSPFRRARVVDEGGNSSLPDNSLPADPLYAPESFSFPVPCRSGTGRRRVRTRWIGWLQRR